jgi:hypothetical protein
LSSPGTASLSAGVMLVGDFAARIG